MTKGLAVLGVPVREELEGFVFGSWFPACLV